jgi:putative peptidoglycan lipid II flippase
MGIATLTSRLFGMVREMVYARFMGDSWVASAFIMALTVPNLFRRLLGEGALTAAFIPIFKTKEKTEGEQAMWQAANAVISGLVIAATVISGLAMLGISVALMTISFHEEKRLMLQLLRVMFPYMGLACLAAIFMGMLNARGYFFVPAFGATVLNLVAISSVLWLAPRFGQTLSTQIFGLAVGMLVAGVAQAAFQLPALRRSGYRYQWVSPWKNPVVSEVVSKMIPGAMGVAAFQLNVVLTQAIAFGVGDEIVASFNYAVRLMELPQGVFGISLATFLLPTLSGLAAEKKYDEFRGTLGQGLGYLSYINLWASAMLVVLAEPIIRLLFERGLFDANATERAGFALTCLAPGLVSFSVVNIMARAFYALGDIKTPMKISMVCLGLNLVFTVPLVLAFKQGGLGIANTMSSLFNVWFLFFALRKKLKHLGLSHLRNSVLMMLAAAVLSGEIAWLGMRAWDRWFGHGNLFFKLGEVFVPMGIAALAYWAAGLIAKIPQANEFLLLVHSKLRRKSSNQKN